MKCDVSSNFVSQDFFFNYNLIFDKIKKLQFIKSISIKKLQFTI